MSRVQGKKLHLKYSESGATLFSVQQTKRRFAICKSALSNNKCYSTRLKNIYDSQEEIEKYSKLEFTGTLEFSRNYFYLQQKAHGGEYFNYDSTCATEGAFYPFVRTVFNSHRPVDEGCIWIGAIDSYPLIFVANSVAKWVCPYSPGGFLRTEPFLPYHEIVKILPRLMNKKIYPDLDLDFVF